MRPVTCLGTRCEVSVKSWKYWENVGRESEYEVEQGWTREVQPRSNAEDTVGGSSTEAKVRGQVDGVNNGTSEPATPGYTKFCPMHEDDEVNSVDMGVPKGKEQEEECI